MESRLVKTGLNFTRRKKNGIMLLVMIGFSSYGVFKLYHMPSVARKRKRIAKILGYLVSLAKMVSDSAEIITVISRDLKEFLKSDSDEIPNSLRQLSKITRSEEFSESLIGVSQSMTIGMLSGYKVDNNSIENHEMVNISDRIVDKLMSRAGTGFVSTVAGNFARNLVLGLLTNHGSNEGFSRNGYSAPVYMQSSSMALSRWLDVLSNDKCRLLAADCIRTFVGTAIAVYLDKTMDANFYDEVFSGLTNPKHQDNTKDILVSLCNSMVETLVKTSHQVLTASKLSPASATSDFCSIIDHSEDSTVKRRKEVASKACLQEEKEINGDADLQNNGWISGVSSTLAVPSNREFVLDVAGRVTFETVRSVIQFFLWRIFEGLKRCVNLACNEVVESGFEVVRYFGSKSSVILTLCLILCLHIIENTRVLLPA